MTNYAMKLFRLWQWEHTEARKQQAYYLTENSRVVGVTRREYSKLPTLLVQLQCALAPLWQTHNSDHLGSEAGATFLVSDQACGIGPRAAGAFLQAVHGPTYAGTANHVPGCHCTYPPWAGYIHWAAEHHGPTQASRHRAGLRLGGRQWEKS